MTGLTASGKMVAKETHGWTASRGPDFARTFRIAARHSRRVRILRIAVPGAVVLAIVTVSIAQWLDPVRILAKLPVGASNLLISGTKITMELPRLSGYTRDARGYELTAKTAAQDLLDQDRVEMKQVHAKVEMQDKSVIEMTAASGVYSVKSEQMTLSEKIVLTTTTGYEATLTEAQIDTRSGHIVSEKPVVVKLLNGGLLNANRLELINSGELVRFDGGVVLTVNPAQRQTTGERASAQ